MKHGDGLSSAAYYHHQTVTFCDHLLLVQNVFFIHFAVTDQKCQLKKALHVQFEHMHANEIIQGHSCPVMLDTTKVQYFSF